MGKLKGINRKSLSLKYRPRDLESIVGHTKAVATLKNYLETKEIPNALLFVGQTGFGKTTLARIFASNVINPDNPPDLSSKALHPDYIELNAADTRGIDDVRALFKTLKLLPTAGHMRVVMLDECHQLTPQATQSLLLPLEDPADHVLYILATTNPEKLPQAMRGRCIEINLTSIDPKLLLKHLASICKKEKIRANKEILKTIISSCGGFPRNCLQGLDAYASYISQNKGMELTEANLDGILAEINNVDVALDLVLLKILISSINKKYKSLVKSVSELSGTDVQIANRLVQLTHYLLDSICGSSGYNVWHTPQNKQAAALFIKRMGDDLDIERLIKLLKAVTNVRNTAQDFIVPVKSLIISELGTLK